jgi:hypothetical protein
MSNLLLLLLLLHFLLSRCHTRPRRETLYTQPTTDKTTTKQKHYIHIYLHVNSSDIYLSMDTDGLEVSNQQPATSKPASRPAATAWTRRRSVTGSRISRPPERPFPSFQRDSTRLVARREPAEFGAQHAGWRFFRWL